MNFEEQVEDAVRRLTHDLVELIREATYSAAEEALTRSFGAGPTPQFRSAAHRAPALSKPAPAQDRGGRRKRDSAELQALCDELEQFVAENPGQRMEQIGRGLNRPTKELQLPTKKLLGERRIRREGQKRSTTYYPVLPGE